MKINKRNLLTLGIIAIIVVIVIIAAFFRHSFAGEIKVVTDKNEYEIGDDLRVKIENGSNKKVCFSSKNSYYLEKKGESGWSSYFNSNQAAGDLIQTCVDSESVKAFGLELLIDDGGEYRIAIPLCANCDLQEAFKEDLRLYSNEFTIK